MKNLKTGIFLIVLGNLLYLAYIFFCGNETSDFGKFSSGLCNLIGVILIIYYMSKNNNEKAK